MVEGIVIPILKEGIDPCSGIPLVAHAPFGNPPLLNVFRPAAIQLYFGEDTGQPYTDRGRTFVCRRVYGNASGSNSIGADPRYLQNRPMTESMFELAQYIEQLLNIKYHYNHCTMVIYLGKDIKPSRDSKQDSNKSSSLGTHRDIVHHGEYCYQQRNSQLPNTDVAIVSFGKSRNVLFSEFREIMLEGRKKAIQVKGGIRQTFLQEHGSLFCLDHRDEIPHKLTNTHFRHSVSFKNETGLSVALCLRVVQPIQVFDIETNTQQLTPKQQDNLKKELSFNSTPLPREEHFNRAYRQLSQAAEKELSRKLVEFVTKRLWEQ